MGDLRTPAQTPVGWRTSGPCFRHVGCHIGNGLRYRFTGRADERGYLLSVSTAGECQGEVRRLRASGAGRPQAPTAQDRDAVLQAADTLLARNLSPTPAAVAMTIAPLRLPAAALSAILRARKLRCGQTTDQFADSARQLEAWAASRARGSDHAVTVVRCQTHPVVKWTMIVPAFWSALQQLLPESLSDPAPWMHYSLWIRFFSGATVLDFLVGFCS